MQRVLISAQTALASLLLAGCVERSTGMVTGIDMAAGWITIARNGAAFEFHPNDRQLLRGIDKGDVVQWEYDPRTQQLTIRAITKPAVDANPVP